MARSIGLSAYLMLSRQGTAHAFDPVAPRPNGRLIWLNAPKTESLSAAQTLAARLTATSPEVHVLITCPEGQTESGVAAQVIHDHPPSDHPETVAAFMAHWQPDAALWLWGDLQPNTVLQAHADGIPLILADADTSGFETRRDRWLREVPRRLLTCFDKALCRSEAAMARLQQLGCSSAQLELCAPLHASATALPFAESDFDDLTHALRGRPVWCAAAVQAAEVPVVLEAHRFAMRMSHRLLLILNPADAKDEARTIAHVQDQGLRHANWDDGAFPDDNCQVLLAPSKGELGLWYRAAPVSFLGSSLSAGTGGLDPLQAAALGSAVLYGPNVRNHLHAYSRLAAAGAARIVNDSSALGVAVARLIAPDQAANMALAAWEVVSESAAVTDRIVDLIQDALDTRAKGA